MAIKQSRKDILTRYLSHYASIFKPCSIENVRNRKILWRHFFFIKMFKTIVYGMLKKAHYYWRMLFSLLFGLFISGCGQSGPLYLPPHVIPPGTTTSPAASHTITAPSTSTTT